MTVFRDRGMNILVYSRHQGARVSDWELHRHSRGPALPYWPPLRSRGVCMRRRVKSHRVVTDRKREEALSLKCRAAPSRTTAAAPPTPCLKDVAQSPPFRLSLIFLLSEPCAPPFRPSCYACVSHTAKKNARTPQLPQSTSPSTPPSLVIIRPEQKERLDWTSSPVSQEAWQPKNALLFFFSLLGQ